MGLRLFLPHMFLMLMGLMVVAQPCMAQDANQTALPSQLRDAPKEPIDRLVIPVRIEHRGTDALGIRLALQLRERFNRSSLFRLSSDGERTIKLLVTTRDEFTGRPELSSIYSVTWLFSTGDGVLSHYLEQHLDLITQGTIASQAEVLVARTDTVAGNYGYLFE